MPYEAVASYGPADLEAVEVYVSPQIPAELSTGFPCGVVAYWSRRTPSERTGRPSLWTALFAAATLLSSFLILR